MGRILPNASIFASVVPKTIVRYWNIHHAEDALLTIKKHFRYSIKNKKINVRRKYLSFYYITNFK